MLLQLTVKNFALIDHLSLEFDPKLNVLTGETGAGKSIIIDAVALLLGARAKSEDIRLGCDKAVIEGAFEFEQNAVVKDLLTEMGFDEDDVLVLTREIAKTGKNTCRVNGRMVTLQNFKLLGSHLINIYGQHDFQAISNKDKHIELLDSLGDETLKNARADVAQSYDDLRRARKALKDMQNAAKDRKERLEFLRFKAQEISELSLRPEEDEELEQELLLLNNVSRIVEKTHKAYQLLYGGNGSVYANLTKSVELLESISSFDEKLLPIVESLQSMSYIAEDHGLTLAKYDDQIDFDPIHKERLEERKYTLDKIKKKYQRSISEILDELAATEAEIAQLSNMEFTLNHLQENYKAQKEIFLQKAKVLTKVRKGVAHQFEEQLIVHLADLAMTNAKFEVRFGIKEASSWGIDDVEFYLSANPGQPLRPLSQIASGGEMSRIMLAFKTILAAYESVNTLIFDEIDSGIGGNIVVMVADKLAAVSQAAQVICVTHSPQIAALAENHFKITKNIINEATITEVHLLTQEEEIKELARMLGGEEDYQLEHAQRLKLLKTNK